jgi:SAM-dependent methyltransferase
MRHEVVKEFVKFIDENKINPKKVAVLGGNFSDPEFEALMAKFELDEYRFFDIQNPASESNFTYTDINKVDSIQNFEKYFDLVISSQVLEHIWNHRNYFDLIQNLTKKDGFCWVNCPTSNLVHGSPDYYSAGFTASYLEKNLNIRKFITLNSGEIGNRRYYLGIHLARYWMTEKELKSPLFGYNFQPGTFLGVLRKLIREIPSRVLLMFFNNKSRGSNDFATESFVGMKLVVGQEND